MTSESEPNKKRPAVAAGAENSLEGTPRYRIGAVAKLTGISAHQLRVWERRYSGFLPSRSPGGGRLYSEADVDRLRLIQRLTEVGNSIGQIAHLGANELQQLLERSGRSVSLENGAGPSQRLRAQFLEAIRELRTGDAERMLAQSSMAFEARAFVGEVLVPLLREIGDLWQSGEFTVAHEHAATEVLRNQLGLLLRTYAQPAGALVTVAATPAGERHGLGVLSAALIAAANGHRLVYLGPDVPAQDLIASVKSTRATTVLLSIVCSADDSKAYLKAVRQGIGSKVQLLLGGAGTADLNVAGVQRLGSLEALDEWLQRQ